LKKAAALRRKTKESYIMRISTNELIIVLVVVLLIFGPKNLPKLGKMFGKTMKNFKEGIADSDEDEDNESAKEKKASKKEEDNDEE
jgi:sec-independent protein translocase protein TatA